MRSWESNRGLVANVLDCDIVVNEFELQSCCYVHFLTNTLGKGMKPLILLPSYSLNSTVEAMKFLLSVFKDER